MECFIVRSDDVHPEAQTLILRGDEARHAIRSLRIAIGEQLITTDLSGTCYLTELDSIDDSNRNELIAQCSILEILPEHNESKRSIYLAQAILQQPSRFEEIIEKSTELGISGCIPLITKRTEKKQINRERIERILREATKQVSRSRMPKLEAPTAFEEALSDRPGSIILLHEAASVESSLASIVANSTGDVILFIGPEGGFTDDEVALAKNCGAQIASLGSRRLRAETAAVAAVSLVSLGLQR